MSPTRCVLKVDGFYVTWFCSPSVFLRWTGSACRGRFPVGGTGAVTPSSSAVTGTGTVRTVVMS